MAVNVFLDSSYNKFLLQRAMVRRFQVSSEEIISVARDLLSYILLVMQDAARMGRFVADIPWIVRHSPDFTIWMLGR